MSLTRDGYKFGQFELLQELPIHDSLLLCSSCGREKFELLQFRYCGTRGALCGACVRVMEGLFWHQMRTIGK